MTTLEKEVATEIIEHSQVVLYLKKFAPIFVILGSIANTVGPYFINAYHTIIAVWVSLAPYHPEDVIPCFFGLCMAFFGGHFLTTFAAIEAYRLCGWKQTVECLKELHEDYLVVKAENDRDNLRDDNNDGIVDVNQISSQELVTRKIRLIIRSMNPEKVSSALNGIWMGFMAVIAVLRMEFAQTIALGATVGGVFQTVANRIVKPILERVVPTEYQKWIPVVISYTCKAIGVSIAWTIQRVISAFYSGIRGGQFFSISLLSLLARKQIIPDYDQGSIVFSAIVGAVAFCGFWWQVSSGFSLPFPINILLFPLSIIEWTLTWIVVSQ